MQKWETAKAVALNLGDLLGDISPGTTSAATYALFDELIQPQASKMKGVYAYIYSGQGAGQSRVVGSFDPSDNETMYDQPFSVVPSLNSNFLFTRHFKYGDYANAIDRMMGMARMKYLDEKVATMQIVATQYEYAVPSGHEYITAIRLVPAGNSDYVADDEVDTVFEFPPRFWRIEPNAGGSFLIAFDPRQIDLSNYGEEWVKVIGQGKPDALGTDNAVVKTDLEEYIVAGATMFLASQKSGENQEWKSKFYMWRDMTRGLEDYVHRTRYGKRVGG